MSDNKRPRKRINRRKLFHTVVLSLLLIGFIIVGMVGGYTFNVIRAMPDYNLDALTGDLTTLIFDNNNVQVGTLRAEKDRLPLDPSDIPLVMKQAIVSIEDQRFFKHKGIDPVRIVGAALANIESGGRSQGASTLTMQLARTAILESQAKKWDRKIQEAWLALKLEKQYHKEQILAHYLNHVYYGHGAYSLQSASNAYFGKDASDLTLGEASALAGIINSPGRFDPYSNMEACKTRQAIVLNQMVDMGYITSEEAQEAKETPLALQEKQSTGSYMYQSFFDHVFNEAVKVLEIEESSRIRMYTSGYKIYTTMDVKTQNKMENVYADPSNFPEGRDGKLIQSAMVLMKASTGEVPALIGGRNINEQRGFNRAVDSLRQPGSVFKPLAVYGPALEMGYGPGTVLDDYPDGYNTKEQKFVNYNNAYGGLTTFRTAVAQSINTVAVKAMEMIGVQAGIDFIKRAGITSLVEEGPISDSGVSIALGGLTNGVSPLELTAAYGAFANEGIYNKPYVIRRIEDYRGNVIYEHSPETHVAMSPQTAYLMTDMMVSAVQSGTATRARMDRPVAGKTGTTSYNVDAWFVGYTADYVASVWLGYDHSDRMYSVFGGSYGAPIWKQIMETAHEGLPAKMFPVPSGITSVTIDAKSGLLPSELTPDTFRISEKFNVAHVPKETSDIWVQAPVCSESELLLTDQCPEMKLGTFLQRKEPWIGNIAPADSKLEVPTTLCDLHGGNGTGTVPSDGSPHVQLNLRSSQDDQGTNVSLSWYLNRSSGNIAFHIYRAQQPNQSPDKATRIKVIEGNVVEYKEKLSATSGKYYYYVQAIDKSSGQIIATSREVSVSTSTQNDSGYATPVLTGRLIPYNGSYSVELTWTKDKPQNKVIYQIYRSNQPDFSTDASTLLSTPLQITTNQYTDSNLESGRTYYYRISGLDLDDNRPIPTSTLLEVNIPGN